MAPPPPSLPTSRQFISDLLNTLNHEATTFPHNTSSNPLANAPDTIKKIFLTLHVLFPNELLPALDVLDRRLVTRFVICRDETLVDEEAGGDSGPAEAREQQNRAEEGTTRARAASPVTDTEMPDMPTTSDTPRIHPEVVYYVRSAQQRPTRTHTSSYDTLITYQVRIPTWTCSCPAFAFAAFPSAHPESPVPLYEDFYAPASHSGDDGVGGEEGEGEDGCELEFGGVAMEREGMPPVCKHLLACVLGERCAGLFGGFVEVKRVGVEEAAGWAAGWGA